MIGRRVTLLAALLLCLTFSSPVGAQSGGGYELTWSTIDGGGGMLNRGGDFSLGGTIGQPDAGRLMSGGRYALAGGFWGSAEAQQGIYLPLILRQYP